ncbi:MAG: T9SS type A sorting domain-containing protein [Flavobacteriales bacterium]
MKLFIKNLNPLKRTALLLGLLFLQIVSLAQASLPLTRSSWASTPAGWTDNPLSSYLTTFACTGSDGGKFSTTGDNNIVNFNSTPYQLSFTVKSNSSASTSVLLVEESADGISYTTVVSLTGTAGLPTTCTTRGPYNLLTTSRYVRWSFTKGSSNMTWDDVSITVPAGPALVVSPTTLTGFSYIQGNGPSTSQSYNLSGTLLTGFPSNITVTAPTNYEVSLDNTSFSGSVLVPYSSATLASTPIYVRLKAGGVVGAYNGEIITNAGGGATTQNVTCSGDVLASSTSDIITANGESATIPSTINTAGPLTSAQGTQVWQFTIRDGGASSPDADNLATIVNSIIFSQATGNAVTNWSTAIKAIDLFDGVTNVGSGVVTTGPNRVTFSGLNINIADNSTKTISVRLTLNCGIGATNFDGEDFGFQISNGNVTFSASGSGKTTFSAITTINNLNVINVVATKLMFTQQPTTTSESLVMSPSVVVTATDACGNTDIDFTGTVSITSTGTLTSSPQTSSAVAGVATFSSIVHSVVGTGYTLTATTGGLTSVVSTTFDITVVTNFTGGDMAIVGICVNQSVCGGAGGEDEISLVSFVDITPGTSFHITDNGFERVGCGSNTWGDGEGVITITRTTSTLAAGTIFTFRILNNTLFTGINPDNNWTVTYPVGTSFNLNSNDEQVYLMQGGVWSDPAGASNATYSGGTYMFAINTYTAWTCNDNTTTRGDLPIPLTCFSIMPLTGTVNVKYTGLTTPASKKDWINRLNNISNWSASSDCPTYNAQVPVYSSGFTFSIIPGGFSSGYWTGALDNDWFDCHNWQNYEVPDSLDNVTIDNVANDPIIGASPATYPNGAICNDLLITNTSGAGVLTLDNALSYFSIKGNITNNGIITGSNGLTELRSANAQSFSGSGATQFYNLRLNNTNASGVSLLQDVTVSNNLTFTIGMLSTGTNKLIITNTTVPTIFGYGNTKFINGNLRHYIANNTSTYVFPIGDGMASTNYKRIDLLNNSLVTTSYIDASVADVPQGTPAADVDANLGASAVQWGTQLTNLLNSAIWTLTPDAQPTSGTYGVNLYVENVSGLSAADDNMFCPVKRDVSSVTYADWSTYLSAPTVIPATGLAGRIYSGGAGYAQRTGYQNFSLHAIAKAPTILPIKLLYFKAIKNGSVVDIDWATTTEINNDYFTIERSKDAFNFEPIFFKKGAGNSSMNLYYSTIDKSPLFGVSYYRLKQTDFDGKYTYSNIESVVFEGADELEIVNTYHAIDNNILTVRVNCKDVAAVNFELYDMTGKKVQELIQTINGDNQTVLLQTKGLSSGVYLLKVFSNSDVITQKVKL